MADFTMIGRHPSIFRITNDVSEAHTVYNKSGETVTAGVIVNVHRGNQIIQHLDDATLVELKSGDSVSLDPTGVSGAVGVGFSSRRLQVDNTAVIEVVESGVVSRSGTTGKAGRKTKK